MAPEIYFPNLGIKINSLSSVAFSIGSLEVYWYGVIIVTAIFIGYFMIERTLNKQGKKIDDILGYILIVLVSSIIGARLYYIIFSLDYYKRNPLEVFNFRGGGLAIYGGVLTAIIVTLIYTKVTKKSFLKLADLFAPYLVLGQAMGRWGNFFNREAFGSSTNSLFAMALRTDTVKNIPITLKSEIVEMFNENYIVVHPTFFFESMWCFIIFGILLYVYNHKKFDGETFAFYIMLYSFGRFFIEGLRTDQLLIGNVPVSQIVAVCLFFTGAGILIYKSRKLKKGNKVEK